MRVGKTGMYEPLYLFEKRIREHERYETIIYIPHMDEKYLKRIIEGNANRWEDNVWEKRYKEANQRLRKYITNRLLEKEELLYFIDRHCDRQPEFYVRDGVKKCR